MTISVLLWAQADTREELAKYCNEIVAVAEKFKTAHISAINGNDPADRMTVKRFLELDDEPSEIPPGTTIHFGRLS